MRYPIVTVTDPNALVAELLAQCGLSVLLILINPSTSNKAPVSRPLSLPDGTFVNVIFVARPSPGFLCCPTKREKDRTTSEKYVWSYSDGG
tara:strand:- start:222 stop:494 length:273 start_codon:yes stop_codon:yes gene_type:complete